MILIHYAHLKDPFGMKPLIHAINAIMIGHIMILPKKYVEYATLNNKLINLQINVYLKLYAQHVALISCLILKLIYVKKEGLLQCAHHQHLIGIRLILDALNALPQLQHLIKELINARLVHFIINGLSHTNNVLKTAHLENNGIIITKSV